MNKEKFLAKGVARKYENGEVLFEVSSLQNHYEGISFHEVDVVDGFIKPSDVFGGDIREIEAEETPYEESEEGTVGIISTLTPEEADVLIKEMNEEVAGIEVVVTEETLIDNPELAEEGIEVGETLTVSASEDFPAWVNPEIAVVSEVVSVDETPADIVLVEEVVAPTPTKKKRNK